MGIFITGGTGYLGGYVITELLERSEDRLIVFTRAKGEAEAREKLWRGLQMHMTADQFFDALERVDFAYGDLQAKDLGFAQKDWDRWAERTDSVLHMAASLNRKSAKACLNSNLRGTLSTVRFARSAVERGGLRRFSHVSTSAVAGERKSEVVGEDVAIDWNRSDYDPYARTKKFAEHMIFELLPDVQKTILRPPTVMGDSRHEETTEFQMSGVFCRMAQLPLVPLDPHTRLDFVPANFVGEGIARIHLKRDVAHERYHLTAGARFCTTPAQIAVALEKSGIQFRLAPKAGRPFTWGFRAMNRLPRGNPLQQTGALLKVFWPYMTYDTVFDNTRVCSELDLEPTPFHEYCAPMLEFVNRVGYRYPYRPLPTARREVAGAA